MLHIGKFIKENLLYFLYRGHLYLFIPRFNCFVERCSKSSCTLCTLRFLRSVRLALEPLMTINRGALELIPHLQSERENR